MTSISISVQNIVDGNGVPIAIMGMLIVFTGLAAICGFIAILPRILALPQSSARKMRAASPAGVFPVPEDEDIMAAIGYVVHRELEELLSDNQKVTVELDESKSSTWGVFHRMRRHPGRGAP